jgi:transmembrane sensor
MSSSDNVVHFPDTEQLEERAAEWAVRVAEGNLTDEEQAAFQSWYTASPRHREMFTRLSQLWKHCDAVAELADHAQADITRASLDETRPRGAIWALIGRRALIAGAAAASIAAVTLLFDRTTEPAPQIAAPVAQSMELYEFVAETAVGERRTVALPDGSSVELNTSSQVTVRYSAGARDVQLTRGEAHFTVASDPARPFSVYAAGRVVTAVGTAFSVQLRHDAVEVTVAEGKVRLSELRTTKVSIPSGQPQVALPALEAGQFALLREGSQQVAALQPAELERRLAWRQGILAFAGEPLLQVLQEIERYTDIVIEVTDPALRDLPVAGRLRIDDMESMLQALQLMADVRVERLNARHVRLRARSGA